MVLVVNKQEGGTIDRGDMQLLLALHIAKKPKRTSAYLRAAEIRATAVRIFSTEAA